MRDRRRTARTPIWRREATSTARMGDAIKGKEEVRSERGPIDVGYPRSESSSDERSGQAVGRRDRETQNGNENYRDTRSKSNREQELGLRSESVRHQALPREFLKKRLS